MEKIKIAFVDELSNDVESKMENGLEEYEMSHGVDVNYKPFSIVLYDENNQVIGAMAAFSSYSSVHIRDLWVDKAHRGKGHGKKMLEELEKHFHGKGMHNINTITCEFQAPDFYRKCGYQVEFVRENPKNPKLTMTFFVKYFDEVLP